MTTKTYFDEVGIIFRTMRKRHAGFERPMIRHFCEEHVKARQRHFSEKTPGFEGWDAKNHERAIEELIAGVSRFYDIWLMVKDSPVWGD